MKVLHDQMHVILNDVEEIRKRESNVKKASFRVIEDALRAQLADSYSEGPEDYLYVEDIDSNNVVYFCHQQKTYAQQFAMMNGDVELVGERVEVRRVTSYVPTNKGADEPATPEKKPAFIDPNRIRFCKAVSKVAPDDNGDLRLVTGIVLEPDTVDAQKDVYNSDEIRKTAHLYMLDFQNIGLQHKAIINHGARPVESWIAPADLTIGDQAVKAGTWLMTVKVFDDDIWKAIKDGDMTGFSIGGWAKRVPVGDGATPAFSA